MIHEDERRILESFPEAKIIKVKQDTVIGKHYHKIKTEYFILCDGECSVLHYRFWETPGKPDKMTKGELIIIEPMRYHEFHIKKDSVLIGINSHPYDPTDDYKL